MWFILAEASGEAIFSITRFHTLLSPGLAMFEYPWLASFYALLRDVVGPLLFVILVLRGVYNRYLHPLSKTPGPFWASITDLYKLSALWSGDVSEFAIRLHQRYGTSSND